MLAAARNHLRRLTAVRIPTSGGGAIATMPQTHQQEGKKSTWTKIKLFSVPVVFFWAGTDRVFSLREKISLAEKWESRLKMEPLDFNEIDASSGDCLNSIEFRKVKCRGVFDQKNSILVLGCIDTPDDPFAYEYSLLTPLILLPPDNQSVCSPILVNRGRVPRDWADYRKIEKFESLEIVRDFPRKEHLSSVPRRQPVDFVGVIRNIILNLQKHFSSVSRPSPVEFVGVIRTGVCSDWLSINVGTLARAVRLDPAATLYVEQIEDTSDCNSNSSSNTVATTYHGADMLGHFSVMIKDHLQMMVIWYCCSGGALYLARWLMKKPL